LGQVEPPHTIGLPGADWVLPIPPPHRPVRLANTQLDLQVIADTVTPVNSVVVLDYTPLVRVEIADKDPPLLSFRILMALTITPIALA